MNALVHAEVLKLRSVRSFAIVALAAIVLIAIAATTAAAAGHFQAGAHPGRDTLAIAGLAQTFALLLGVLAVTSEFRHGTITPAVLITPRRTRLLIAKLITVTCGGLMLGAVAFSTAAAIALPVLSSRGIASGLNNDHVVAIVAGGTVATALFAALGLGIGTIVRNQVGAIIAVLILLYAIEPLLTLLPGIGNTAQQYGLGGLSSGASGTTALHSGAHLLGQAPAALVLTAYAISALAAGTVLLRHRDITA
jgi:ABC-2 type transport system permease protein